MTDDQHDLAALISEAEKIITETAEPLTHENATKQLAQFIHAGSMLPLLLAALKAEKE
jgi:hypothetical protein